MVRRGSSPSASKPNLGNPSVSAVRCRATAWLSVAPVCLSSHCCVACLRFSLALSSLVLARLDVLSPIRTVSGLFCMNEESCIWGALLPSPVSASSQASAQFEIGNDLPAGVIALHGMVYVRLADFGARCLFVFFFCCSARAAPFLSGTADGKTLSPLDGKGQDLTPA
jgi:hypothetical protein